MNNPDLEVEILVSFGYPTAVHREGTGLTVAEWSKLTKDERIKLGDEVASQCLHENMDWSVEDSEGYNI